MDQSLKTAIAACLVLCAASCIANATLAGKSSGLIGCRAKEIAISEQSTRGLVRTWIASCRGRDYQCNITGESGDTACAPLDGPKTEAKPAVVPPIVTPPPTGAGGFAFGASLAESEKACRDAGHEWTPGSNEHTCSGTVTSMELPARARLAYRGDKLTSATLSIASSRSPADVFGKLSGALRVKYGEPRNAKDMGPPACESAVPQCLNDGRMTASRTWTWGSGEMIVLFVGPPEGTTVPVVTVRYERDTAPTDGL